MPAGLDGNPDPIVTDARTAVLNVIADAALALRRPASPLLIAIDGIDGSGKSTFADELGVLLRSRGEHVVRSTIDSFHKPRRLRYARGARSPLGFFLDSHNLQAVRDQLLCPLAQGAGSYVAAIFDEPSDQPVSSEPIEVSGSEVLVFDGIFAMRDELAHFWDFSVFLDGQHRVNLSRLDKVMTDLPTEPIDVVAHVLEWQARFDRPAAGLRYYLDLVDPMRAVDIVIDNNDLANPRVVNPDAG